MNVVAARQIKHAEQFENTEKNSEALVKVLKQACARNRAVERQELWAQKDRESSGSKTTFTLKSNDGEVVKTFAKVPQEAETTSNNFNKYEEERRKNADSKEDVLLHRFCDGLDNAWRPDSFFTEECGEDDVPPWPVRPMELFTNPHLCMRIMSKQLEKKKEKKLAKKAKAGATAKELKKTKKKKSKDKKRSKKHKKQKKEKKDKAEKKKEKVKKRGKDKKADEDLTEGKSSKRAKKKERSSSSSSSSSPESSSAEEAAAHDAEGGSSSSS